MTFTLGFTPDFPPGVGSPMQYSDWINAIGGYVQENIVDPTQAAPFITGSRYNTIVPRCIEYAEFRIYREPDLDFLACRQEAVLTAAMGVRTLAKPNTMLVVEEARIIPVGNNGTGLPLRRMSNAAINQAFPLSGANAQPVYWSQISDTNLIFGPTPDQNYTIKVYGTFQPMALSSTNTTTFLTQWFPDLFLAATMIFLTGYQKNLGDAIGQPAPGGGSWETYYEALKAGGAVQEARKKAQSAGWSPSAPTSVATPPRA
jgi:hypothetical protein